MSCSKTPMISSAVDSDGSGAGVVGTPAASSMTSATEEDAPSGMTLVLESGFSMSASGSWAGSVVMGGAGDGEAGSGVSSVAGDRSSGGDGAGGRSLDYRPHNPRSHADPSFPRQ